MKTIRLSELFEIYNGTTITKNDLYDYGENLIAVVGASGSINNTIVGYIEKGTKQEFPAETLYVSTNGAGACTAFVSAIDFVMNSDASALIPKEKMSFQEKQFYALCITKNKYKFSYGRKPKGDRLANILLPDRSEIPDWVYNTYPPNIEPYKDQIDKYLRNGKGKLTIKPDKLYDLIKSGFFDKNESFSDNETPELNTESWEEFKISDLFQLKRGKRLKSADRKPGSIPYYSASESNNGLTDKISNPLFIEEDALIYTTFGDCYYVEGKFTASDEITILKNDKINKYSGLFLSIILSQDKFRFSFGRKAFKERIEQLTIKLPTTAEGEPDYKFMESYIKTLPYSKHI